MLISGKEISKKVRDQIKDQVTAIKNANKRVPKLVVILVGEDPASKIYVRNKARGCDYVGMASEIIRKPAETTEDELVELLESLNHDDSVDGILVQLPLPKQINENRILNIIDPTKDVDGFHPSNVAKLVLEEDGLQPCTPRGMMVMLEEIGYDLTGKEVVVVGRSNIVGKPVAFMALNRNATVTICHSRTRDLEKVCQRADVLIAATGKPKMFNHNHVKKGAVVLDVGMDHDENGKLCGDVDFDDVKDIVSYITPVPGGVGPMTITMLLDNTLKAYQAKQGD
ncbi:MAG: bifunctional methylenetetrahydrofolate dehydrogenase/methenyltetrahydrofolate cyclohydrolase FolD [Erysipelotrichaceae bacterium]|nr:bifunctional methylenetetrahydrofolate dehydrogenase/methenyltetrahydrofolate cyclohydrolase FolD [Erysipelotrichaceae bacterium]